MDLEHLLKEAKQRSSVLMQLDDDEKMHVQRLRCLGLCLLWWSRSGMPVAEKQRQAQNV